MLPVITGLSIPFFLELKSLSFQECCVDASREKLFKDSQFIYTCYPGPIILASPEFHPKVTLLPMVGTGLWLICFLVTKGQKMVFLRRKKGAH